MTIAWSGWQVGVLVVTAPTHRVHPRGTVITPRHAHFNAGLHRVTMMQKPRNKAVRGERDPGSETQDGAEWSSHGRQYGPMLPHNASCAKAPIPGQRGDRGIRLLCLRTVRDTSKSAWRTSRSAWR